MKKSRKSQDNPFVLVEKLSFVEKYFPLAKELDLVIFSDKRILDVIFSKLDLNFELDKKIEQVDDYFKKKYKWSKLEFLKNRSLIYLLK